MANKREFLPKNIKNRVLRGVEYSFEQRDEIFNKFINKFRGLVEEDPENFKKSSIILAKIPDKKKVKLNKGHNTKKLTFKNRRELGLYALGRKSLRFKDLVPLHELWKDYMIKYMKLKELKNQKWENNPEDPNYEMIHQKLYRADLHGCLMEVVQSKCYSHVGKCGIVVMETKNCFKLLGTDNIVRSIPKVSNAFTFKIEDFMFKFYGKNFQGRPAERSSKKLKTIYANEL